MGLNQPKLHAGHIELAVAKLFNYRRYIIVPNVSWGWLLNYEADMILYNPSSQRCTEVEIKVSSADFKKDFTKNRFHDSKKVSYLYFAIPENLLELAIKMLPKYCGIIVVKWNGYRYFGHRHRMAKLIPLREEISTAQALELARLGCMRIWSLKEHNNR